MAKISSFTKANLDKQGFGNLDNASKSRYAWPLRFTPAVGTILVVAGLLLRSPVWLASIAVVAASGVLFPRAMIIDLVYNYSVRYLFGAPALPAIPRPRRFSYAISATALTGSALAFNSGHTTLGLVLGGLVVIGGTILTVSLWCLGSWLYRTVFRLT
ncbi:MAG: DUF4395 family protein [Candidatus Saccharibacteria bacterium]